LAFNDLRPCLAWQLPLQFPFLFLPSETFSVGSKLRVEEEHRARSRRLHQRNYARNSTEQSREYNGEDVVVSLVEVACGVHEDKEQPLSLSTGSFA